jgi:hypothetical protein
VVDEVVITLPMKSLYDEASTIARLCEEQGILVRYLSNPFNLNFAKSRADHFEGDTIITLTTGRMRGVSLILKRGLDIVASFPGILLLTPLFLVVSLWIKFTSGGGVDIMPVIKYRSFEEAQKAMWCFWPTREYYRKLADLFEFSNQIFSHFQRPLPGILKYKSLDQSARWSIEQNPKSGK